MTTSTGNPIGVRRGSVEGGSLGVTGSGRRVRVLLVPDTAHWVLGEICGQVARYCRGVEAAIVSSPLLGELIRQDPELPRRVDVAHFVDPRAGADLIGHFSGKTAVVTSIHHVDEWERVSHNTLGDLIVTGSRQWAERLIARGVERSRVVRIPYGVNTERFHPPGRPQRRAARRWIGLPPGTLAVGFIAKRSSDANARKGVDVFIEAVRHLSRQVDEVAAVIVGPGWSDVVESLGAMGVRCVWMPYLTDHARVARVYRALDFYWVTSRIEGGPVTLLEAMSSGVVCLSTRVGLATEVLDHRTGRLLPFDDPLAFAAATAELWHDRRALSAMSAASRQRMVEGYRSDLVCGRYAELYRRAVEQAEGVGPASRDQRRWEMGPILSRSEARWVRGQEALRWLRQKGMGGGDRASRRLALRACLSCPSDPAAWHALAEQWFRSFGDRGSASALTRTCGGSRA